ncbi:sulfotransferase family protein [Actinomadura fulvescens]|uniref:Branched chain amino acid aminotransferase n=1 Tax=Actinomadura fulvescens TaxID=46160 RepID=A0ABP6BQD8_9ACTN
MTGPRLLALWSAPRSRSTAFLRMMAERGDYTVVHEPFSQVVDFGRVMVGEREVRDEAAAIAALRALSTRAPVFFKDTTDFAFPGVLADADFLAETTHTFIIRHPGEAIASHFALNPGLERDEIGFARLAALYDAVTEAAGAPPVVIDSDDLIERPVETVRSYCRLVGLDFRAEALSWRPGLRAEWRRTRRWHEATSRTDSFVRTARAYADTTDNNPVLAGYLDYHLPFYERLHAHRMIIEPA